MISQKFLNLLELSKILGVPGNFLNYLKILVNFRKSIEIFGLKKAQHRKRPDKITKWPDSTGPTWG